jgi:hypothetical protein
LSQNRFPHDRRMNQVIGHCVQPLRIRFIFTLYRNSFFTLENRKTLNSFSLKFALDKAYNMVHKGNNSKEAF